MFTPPSIRLSFKISPFLNNYWPPDNPRLEAIREELKEWWYTQGSLALNAAQDRINLHFANKEADVYIYAGPRSFSDPIFISSDPDPRGYAHVLIHQLIHRLLTYNREGYVEDIHSVQHFPDLSPATAIHIGVYALHAYICTDLLEEPDTVADNIRMCEDKVKFIEAWEHVLNTGYATILDTMFKRSASPPTL